MRPADALDRIVYLLDRALAEGQKVRAFARARDVVDEVGDDQVERLHAHGDLTGKGGHSQVGDHEDPATDNSPAGVAPHHLGRVSGCRGLVASLAAGPYQVNILGEVTRRGPYSTRTG